MIPIAKYRAQTQEGLFWIEGQCCKIQDKYYLIGVEATIWLNESDQGVSEIKGIVEVDPDTVELLEAERGEET